MIFGEEQLMMPNNTVITSYKVYSNFPFKLKNHKVYPDRNSPDHIYWFNRKTGQVRYYNPEDGYIWTTYYGESDIPNPMIRIKKWPKYLL